MKKILVAGASGYLGKHIVKTLKARGYWVRVLVRGKNQKINFKGIVDDIYVGQATQINTLSNIMDDIDIVISTLGITRQQDGMTYMDVDYNANLNLLKLAETATIDRFLYVSVLNAELFPELKIIQAKERFVTALQASNLEHIIIRPNGFYSDMLEILNMAKSGRGWIIGDGKTKVSPISGQDLAKVCVTSLKNDQQEYKVGGPQTFTLRELYELAFSLLNKPVKISSIPSLLVPPTLFLMRKFTSSKFYGPIEFFLTAMTMKDMPQGTLTGTDNLSDFYKAAINSDIN